MDCQICNTLGGPLEVGWGRTGVQGTRHDAETRDRDCDVVLDVRLFAFCLLTLSEPPPSSCSPVHPPHPPASSVVALPPQH